MIAVSRGSSSPRLGLRLLAWRRAAIPATNGDSPNLRRTMSDMRVVIAGAGGRMGRTLISALAATKGLALAGAVDAPGSAVIGRDAGELAGLGPNGIKVASDVAPLLKAADGLIKRVAATLNDDYDIEIFEMHHNKKIDAPSGTALLLGRAAAEGRGIDLAKRSERGRDGMTGARKPGDIGFASLRGGTVVGEHSVIFAGPAERVELTHRAEDRLIFARGALHAALWARGKKPGLYSMADVLGLGDK